MDSMAPEKPKPKPLLVSSPPSKRIRTDDSEETMDFISDLPDQLLHHILSFLDMIFVVRTSILSKRWRHVWKSLHILSFNEEVFNGHFTVEEDPRPPRPDEDWFVVTYIKNDPFMDFVKWVLGHLDDAGNVATFSISGICTYTWAKNDPWTRFRRDNADSVNRRTLDLPLWFFTCKALTSLKLDMGYKKGRTILKIPYLDPLSLPSLRTLHLESFLFVDGNNVGRFLSRCVVLEKLVIFNCLMKERSSLTISAPQLKNLEVSLSRPKEIDGEDLIGKNHNVIVVAPKLTSFRCGHHLLSEFCLDLQNVSSLVEADIDGHLNGRYNAPLQVLEEYSGNVMKCLNDIDNVESLTIYVYLLEDVHQAHPNFGREINPFRSLRCLKMKTTYLKEVIVMLTLLEACPHLETLVLQRTTGIIGARWDADFVRLLIKHNLHADTRRAKFSELVKHISKGGDPVDMVVNFNLETEEDWETKEPAQCLSNSLKFVEIQEVYGTYCEFKMIKYLLKNAMALVRVDIFSRKSELSPGDRSLEIFTRKVAALQQPSSTVEICFHSES